MKKYVSMLMLLLSLFASQAPAATKKQATPDQEAIIQNFSKATVALYIGKQECKWVDNDDFFGPDKIWSCHFKTAPECTATVIHNEDDTHIALTAGHCFDWKDVRAGNYYVADGISTQPIVHRVHVIKFENDARYDFALLEFRSGRDFAEVSLNGENDGPPAVGAAVANVNFAYGITKQFQLATVVSGIVGGEESPYEPGLRRRYLINLAAGPGASGSALVDLSTGKIVGLVEAYFPGTQIPMAAIPTGKLLFDFMDDDSAGMAPKPAPPRPEEHDASIFHTNLTQTQISATSELTFAAGLLCLAAALGLLISRIVAKV